MICEVMHTGTTFLSPMYEGETAAVYKAKN